MTRWFRHRGVSIFFVKKDDVSSTNRQYHYRTATRCGETRCGCPAWKRRLARPDEDVCLVVFDIRSLRQYRDARHGGLDGALGLDVEPDHASVLRHAIDEGNLRPDGYHPTVTTTLLRVGHQKS